MRRCIATILAALALLLLLPAMPAAAEDFPKAIWAPLEQYRAAEARGDDQAMLEYGEVIVALAEGMADDFDTQGNKTSFLAGRYEELARLTERMGLLDKALYYCKKTIPYATAMGWDDGVKFNTNKISALTPIFHVYGETTEGSQVYYGAKFEPRQGTLYGSTYDDDPKIGFFRNDLIRPYFPKNESTYLIYLEWGHDPETETRYGQYFEDARANGRSVMFAWNTYGAVDVTSSAGAAYVDKVINFLGNSGVDVFLRFGAEMNTGPSGDNRDNFLSAFRTIADKAHSKSNIATVWSPSDMGAVDRPFADYYPGDQYVDWMGVSSYSIKYFGGNTANLNDDVMNTYFYTGEFSSPILRLTRLVSFMEERGIQKPIMLSECGVPHRYNPTGEDLTSFGEPQFYELYAELPKYFPQVKLINYFNVQMQAEQQDYSLHGNARWQSLYNQLIAPDYFISSYGSSAPYRFQEVTEAVRTNKLSAVFYYPKSKNTTVRYLVDGQQAAELRTPYEYTLPSGDHSITVQAICNGSLITERHYQLSGGVLRPADGDAAAPPPAAVQSNIKVLYNGVAVQFADQQPEIVDSRTLIPARGVLETMGATVSWDEAASKVTVQRGDVLLELVIGRNSMTVNGTEREIDVPPMILNGRTMVPVRVISEALGAQVGWDGASSTVTIDE